MAIAVLGKRDRAARWIGATILGALFYCGMQVVWVNAASANQSVMGQMLSAMGGMAGLAESCDGDRSMRDRVYKACYKLSTPEIPVAVCQMAAKGIIDEAANDRALTGRDGKKVTFSCEQWSANRAQFIGSFNSLIQLLE